MPDPNLSDWLASHPGMLDTLALEADVSADSTILPTVGIGQMSIELAQAQLGTKSEVVLLAHTLGEGGMGVVHLGTQTSLSREVAVKSLKPEVESPERLAKLVQEAWVTSFLEHPNIVPIYDLTHDEQDRPLLVMRRIEGAPWSELLADPFSVQDRFGVEDPLDWHLRVLMQLASALHFAHGRKVLHLDLKPDNVMIGPWGEVYLVDWGLAMALDGGDRRLPEASRNQEVLGTPAFLAPEMATGEGGRLGVHTDVYLLGSTLYAVLAGRPPHTGGNLIQILFSALQASRAPLPVHVSPELAGIVDRAMAIEPGDRYPSAEAFRLALQDFLQHRGALALMERASEQLVEVDRRLADDPAAAIVAEVSAARFGFQQALAAWPGSDAAQEGFDRATAHYARWCAAQGDLATAEVLAAELSRPDPGVDEALDAARREAAAEAERLRSLRSLGDQHNARTGQRTRLLVLAVIVISGSALTGAAWFIEGMATWDRVLTYPLVIIAMVLGGVAWGRESLLATRFNRAGMVTFVAMSAAQFGVTWSGYRFGVGLDETMAMVFAVWGLAAVLFAVGVETRLWPSSAAYALGAVVSVAHPPFWPLASALCNLAVLLNALVIWRPGASLPAKPADP